MKPIIVFDSGYGGISVLKSLVAEMPNENYLYYGDSANAPYGPRPIEQIRELTLKAIRPLLSRQPKAVVIACNTATAAALENVKALCPGIPVVGIRPALRQAEAAGCRRILSLATAGTLASESYARQLKELCPQTEIISIAAPGIVEYVEGKMNAPEKLMAYLRSILFPACSAPIDGAVLGCTHFPFVKEEISAALGRKVPFFDAGDDTAKETRRALESAGLRETREKYAGLSFMNSLKTEAASAFSQALFDKAC